MDYKTYFTTQPTDKIAKDLIGRPLYFNNGEKLGGSCILEKFSCVSVHLDV